MLRDTIVQRTKFSKSATRAQTVLYGQGVRRGGPRAHTGPGIWTRPQSSRRQCYSSLSASVRVHLMIPSVVVSDPSESTPCCASRARRLYRSLLRKMLLKHQSARGCVTRGKLFNQQILSYLIFFFWPVSETTVTVVHASSHPSKQLFSVMNRPERFNAKARRSSLTASSHKGGKQRRLKRHSALDTNPEILPRKSTEEKELDRREQLKKEVSVYLLHASPVLPHAVTLAVSVEGIEQEEKEVGQIHCACTIFYKNAEKSFPFSGKKTEEGRACRVVRETCVGGPLLASISFTDSWIK